MTLEEGNDKVIALHDKLYTGVLAPFLRKDLGYIPHIGLGLFLTKSSGYKVTDPTPQALDDNKHKIALQEAESLILTYWVELDNLELVTLDDKATKIVTREQILFGNS